jgi:putative peptide maturation system protein
MVELNELVALEVNGEEVSLYDVLKLAKLSGTLKFVEDGVTAALIQQGAHQRDIKVSDEELQQAADNYRMQNDLHDAETTEDWLQAQKLSYEDWESLLESQVKEAKLREALTAASVEQRFTEQRLTLDKAAISRLVLAEEGVARELRAQIVEDGADFHALAREYSTHANTRPAGGYAGLISRTDMEPALEAAVFGSQPGKVVGPIKTDDGWELVKVERLALAELDDEMRETLKTKLFNEWLSEQRRKARIRLPLLESSQEEEAEK